MEDVKKKESPWISVHEKLPEGTERVLCLAKRQGYIELFCICWFEDGRHFYLDGVNSGIPVKVDYWMPIPKSPEEE